MIAEHRPFIIREYALERLSVLLSKAREVSASLGIGDGSMSKLDELISSVEDIKAVERETRASSAA